MSETTDRDDPRLGYGSNDEPRGQNAAYLVLSAEERARGFVRPVRTSYRHAGIGGPTHPLRDLTPEERERHDGSGYVKFEEYPPSESPKTGRFWRQADLDAARPCGAVTTMSVGIAETYARQPDFYGATFCVRCSMHRPVGPDGEFVWLDGSKVGT